MTTSTWSGIACLAFALTLTGRGSPPQARDLNHPLCGGNPAQPQPFEPPGNLVRVFHAATADSTSAPVRSLEGPNTALCSPQDLAIDEHGRLHVLSSRLVTVYDSAAAGDAEPVRYLAVTDSGIKTTGLGLDRSGNIHVATDEAGTTDPGSITVYAPGADGDRPARRTLLGALTGLHRPVGIAVDPDGRIYATNAGGDSVRIYGRDANGDIAPEGVLAGPATRLKGPHGIAFDSRGYLYVVNSYGRAVTVYAPGAVGDVAPVRTLERHETRTPMWLNGPTALALDAHDTLYVAAHSGILVYAPDANGKVPPVRSIRIDRPAAVAVGQDGVLYVARQRGPISVFARGAEDSAAALRTIEGPDGSRLAQGLALGPGDTLFVAGMEGAAVIVYPPGARGVAPSARKLSGPATGVSAPNGIAVDRRGTLYVANGPQPRPEGAIRVYDRAADGTASPVRVIAGRATRLAQPTDVAFDSRGDMYVVNSADLVTVYAARADGDVAPLRVIVGPNTLLRRPIKLAFGPGDTLYVLNGFEPSRFGTANITVTVYAPYAEGEVEPVRSITVIAGAHSAGARLGLMSPAGIAVDAQGAVFVAASRRAVAVYPPGADGDVLPVRLIRGGKTKLLAPVGVALGRDGGLYVAAIPERYPRGFFSR